MVDVTHDGDDRRTSLEVFIVFFGGFGIEIDVEGLEQLTVFVFGRDDLDLVAELLAEDLEGRLVEDWVIVAISPRWKSTVTRFVGSVLIFSAKWPARSSADAAACCRFRAER